MRMVVIMMMRCVKLVRANSYRILVLMVQQKARGYRRQIRYIPIKGPIKVHVAG